MKMSYAMRNALIPWRLRSPGVRGQQPIVRGHQPVVHGHQPVVRDISPLSVDISPLSMYISPLSVDISPLSASLRRLRAAPRGGRTHVADSAGSTRRSEAGSGSLAAARRRFLTIHPYQEVA